MPRPLPASASSGNCPRPSALSAGTTAATGLPWRVITVGRPRWASARIEGNSARAASTPLRAAWLIRTLYGLYGTTSRAKKIAYLEPIVIVEPIVIGLLGH